MGGKIIGNENMMQLYYNFENKTYKREKLKPHYSITLQFLI